MTATSGSDRARDRGSIEAVSPDGGGLATLPVVVPSAYLRVYQPLDAFERDEQAHWERYLVERTAGT